LLSYLRDDCRKQVILIFEGHGNSNRCTPYWGKPDQHTTRIPRSDHVWPQTIRISHGQCIATFRKLVNRFIYIHCPREEGLPTQSTARRPSDPRVRTELLSYNSQWGSGEKISFCWLSKWFCDTSTGAATGATRCGSFVGKAFSLLVVSPRWTRWTR
jgi:hypothetical protein